MIKLSSAINKTATQSLEVWAVITAHREELPYSSVRLFSSYAAAKNYFNRVIPYEESVAASEDIRVAAEERIGGSETEHHNRQYYLDNDYYENWCVEEWSDDYVMSWHCCIERVRIDET